MGSLEDYFPPVIPSQRQEESTLFTDIQKVQEEFNLVTDIEKAQEEFVKDIERLILRECEKANFEKDYSSNSEGSYLNGDTFQYPLRPYAEDCSFYLRTGRCKYGLYCKFSHPLRRVYQVKENQKGGPFEQTVETECKFYLTVKGCKYGNACKYSHLKLKSEAAPVDVNLHDLRQELNGTKENGKEKDGFLDLTRKIECKYHLAAGGCKYGKACKYAHSKEITSTYLEKSEVPPPELNFLGLPVRKLEKDCPFYMRSGSCGYGVECRYNHPEPIALEGSGALSSSPAFEDHSLGHHNGTAQTLPIFGATQPASESWHTIPDDPHPNMDNHSSQTFRLHPDSSWDRHQGSRRQPHLSSAVKNGTKTTYDYNFRLEQTLGGEFPQRPGEPDCSYFMKTGFCKYGAACIFNHPNKQNFNQPNLNSSGLPLRPGRRTCQHYESYGICKFGPKCYFHHPEEHADPSAPLECIQAPSVSEISDAASGWI